jgi:alkylation response protein AidB-like acyl-CoA dehydrogenase
MSSSARTATGLDDATREMLADSLREVFNGGAGAASISAALEALGWEEVRGSDPAGATTLLFTEQGRALASSRALDDVLLSELSPVLPEAAGSRAVLVPLAEEPDATGGVLLGPLDGIAEVVVPTSKNGAVGLSVVPAARFAETAAPIEGFDPRSDRLLVAGPPPTGERIEAGDAWTRAVAAGHRALASEIIGVCEAALSMAVAHTSAREQYGRPIASFQAVRHRLAEARVWNSAARTTVETAWALADGDDAAWSARTAKMRAGRAQADVLRHTVQVLGAMGLTLESDMHRHVTRAAALDALLGNHGALAEATGADLLAGADARPLVEI